MEEALQWKTNTHRKHRHSPIINWRQTILTLLSLSTSLSLCTGICEASGEYSQPLTTIYGSNSNDDNIFRPMMPKDISREFISRNVFTKAGKYRVFEPLESESDLRLAVAMKRNDDDIDREAAAIDQNVDNKYTSNGTTMSDVQTELKGLEDLLVDYVEQFFTHGKYEPLPGLVLALQQNHTTNNTLPNSSGKRKRDLRQAMEEAQVQVNLPRALQSGRLLFGAGLKKIMWPIYMGLQVLKSLLFALFLPTIIGSVSRLIGKGLTSGSAGSAPLFIRPMEAPQELDFRDNSISFDDDKFGMTEDTKNAMNFDFNAEASQQQSQYTSLSPNAINQEALSRYGGQQQQQQQLMQDTYLSALQSIGAASFKNSQSLSGSSSGGLAAPGMAKKPPSPANMNTFQSFQNVPNSSLLLSNYDPFYSPLLSRLDSVFAQLKLNSAGESCREKLICLMYSNPAKYAPYSNLVSAQLSRELNELRKPTSDNPDILRFFKYMRAAKDGQDGVDCEQSYVKCKEFKDFENPAMLSTYNDINKLVQARKLA